jgi:hypothetical protein
MQARAIELELEVLLREFEVDDRYHRAMHMPQRTR